MKNFKKTSSSNAGLFIGRFQPFHHGHKACINKILETHNRCIILVRNTDHEFTKKTKYQDLNPFPLEYRLDQIKKTYKNDPRIDVYAVEDFDTIYIGRDVGYGLIQLDDQLEQISGTDLRTKLYKEKNV